MHGHLDQKSIIRILLKLESIQECLRFLEQAQRPFKLFARDEMNRAVVQFVENDGYLILVKIQLFAVHFLERVFKSVVRATSQITVIVGAGAALLPVGLFFLGYAEILDIMLTLRWTAAYNATVLKHSRGLACLFTCNVG